MTLLTSLIQHGQRSMQMVFGLQLKFRPIWSSMRQKISSIFDKCSILQQTQSQPNHTSNKKCISTNLLQMCYNIESKMNQPLASEKYVRLFFSFLIVSDGMVFPDPKFLIFNFWYFLNIKNLRSGKPYNQTPSNTMAQSKWFWFLFCI